MKGKVNIDVTADEQAVKDIVLNDEKLKTIFEGKNIVKFIYVKNKIINVVIK